MTDRKLYNTGWDDCLEYNRDWRNLQQSKAGAGMMMMLIGALLTALTVIVPAMMWYATQTIYNWHPLIAMGCIGIFLLVSGYFVDKRGLVRYKEREDDFYRKWADRWNELGFTGDDS